MVKIVVRCEMLFSKKSFHKKKKKEPLQRRYSSDPNDLKCKLNIYVAAAPTLWGVKIFIAKTHNELSHDDEWTVWWAGIFHSGTNPPPPPKKQQYFLASELGECCGWTSGRNMCRSSLLNILSRKQAASFHLPPPFKKVQHQQNVEQLLHCSEHIKIHLT